MNSDDGVRQKTGSTHGMSDENGTELSDVMEFDIEQTDGERWMILYPDDYNNFARGLDGNIGLKLNRRQAAEIVRLGYEIFNALEDE